MKAIILAAGYATRLHPLTLNTPKPLLKVAGVTIMSHILDKLEQVAEIDEVLVVTNARFYDNFVSWAELELSARGSKGTKFSKKLTIINDGTQSNETRLGAVGDINYVLKEQNINENLLVVAGDNLFGFSLRDFANEFHAKESSLVAFYDMKEAQAVRGKFGVGIIDVDNRIVDFQEKPQTPRSTLASTACYLFSRDDVNEIANLAKHASLDNPGDLVKYLAARNPVHGFVFDSHWFDVGSVENLKQAQEFYEALKIEQ